MVVEHHTFPFAACHLLIIIIGKPFVFLHQFADGQTIAYSSCVIHHGYTSRGYCRIIYQLIKCILGGSGYAFL